MNIGLITSTIIGGVLLLMLAFMNIGVGKSATEVTVSGSKQALKSDIQEIVSNDFLKIGYDFTNSLVNKIISADSNSITFQSNLDNSSDASVESITWELTGNAVSSTQNPNDYILTRAVDGSSQSILAGVTRFRLDYYDGLGDTIPLSFPLSATDLSNIRQIEITLELQSAEALKSFGSNEENYIVTTWNKRFTPRNLSTNL